ncbi:prenyltransferase/squalene oxidase repeat-containing protein [Streptomyces sp. NPDC127051]|uniref:prenyltransferase/squalene oxidase repeat-containing protein n=1 Tax=Streptomyces sp. NPDC127051 TaxID=3347119 RepID=UPI00364D9864
MTTTNTPSPANTFDAPAAAAKLITDLIAAPWGRPTPSLYETARLVTLAPWLTGHHRRLQHLLGAQHSDGNWGPAVSEGFALVPTLSATEALLTTMQRTPALSGTDRARVTESAHRGLQAALRQLTSRRTPLPDTHAIELVVPALIEAVNTHLHQLHDAPSPDLPAWPGPGRLPLPPDVDPTLLASLRSRLQAGGPVPDKVLYSLETTGDAARGARAVRPVPPGTVGASPAATAAWLGPAPTSGPALRYLETVVSDNDALAPAPVPIDVFERAAVVGVLARAGLRPQVPAPLVKGLIDALGPEGAPGGAGLPADGDTTSIVLFTLAQLGIPQDPGCLFKYEQDDHFCTWPGERTASPSTNAHQLEALGQYLASAGPNPPDAPRYQAAVTKTSTWICDQQRADGSWDDKWHASPYYPGMCCTLALAHYGVGAAGAVVDKAVHWVLSTQRPDGSWGRWQGTVEETAYALLTLQLSHRAPRPAAERAIARGSAYLLSHITRPDEAVLWTGKDLYHHRPLAQAPAVAALHLAQQQAPGTTPGRPAYQLGPLHREPGGQNG